MPRRIAALLFIIAIVGQFYAGVCGCVGGGAQPRHSCCKRQKTVGDVISRKNCCPSECLLQPSEKPLQDRVQATAKIKFETVKAAVETPRSSFERIVVVDVVRLPPFSNHRLKYPRPPELYLRHRAFLI